MRTECGKIWQKGATCACIKQTMATCTELVALLRKPCLSRPRLEAVDPCPRGVQVFFQGLSRAFSPLQSQPSWYRRVKNNSEGPSTTTTTTTTTNNNNNSNNSNNNNNLGRIGFQSTRHRDWRAASAEGLQGKGSRKRSAFQIHAECYVPPPKRFVMNHAKKLIIAKGTDNRKQATMKQSKA